MDFEKRRKDSDQLCNIDKDIELAEQTLSKLQEMRREVVNRLGINKGCEEINNLNTGECWHGPFTTTTDGKNRCARCGKLFIKNTNRDNS